MKRNWIFLALLVSVGVNCGLLGMGIARHRMRVALEREVRPAAHDGARLADRLELSGEAREGFLRLQRELAERVQAGRRRIDEARHELRRELTSPDPDRARVEALLAGIAAEQDALDRALVANVFAARELLEGPAEREYLRFVEHFGGAVAGARPQGPPPGRTGGMRPRFGGRGPRGQDGPQDPPHLAGPEDRDPPGSRRGPQPPP